MSKTFVKMYHPVLADTRLSSTDKLVYSVLLSYQESGLQVFPSNSHIAKTLGVSERSVIRSTKALELTGLIVKNRRFNKTNLVDVKEYSDCQNVTPDLTDCHLQTCQVVTSRPDRLADYKNTYKNKDNISLEEETESLKGITESNDSLSLNVKKNNLVIKKDSTVTKAVNSSQPLEEDDEPLDDPDALELLPSYDDEEDMIDTFEDEELCSHKYRQPIPHDSNKPFSYKDSPCRVRI